MEKVNRGWSIGKKDDQQAEGEEEEETLFMKE